MGAIERSSVRYKYVIKHSRERNYPMKKQFSDQPKSCPCCSTAVIYNDRTPPHNINIQATCDELIKRCSNGEMNVIRGDCPIEMMVGLFNTDTIYTIVQFLHCNACSKTIFWGLCVRGAPIYKAVERDKVDKWPWEDKRKY